MNEEGMLRIGTGDNTLMAGEFLPWVHRLELDGELDRAVLMLGLEQIGRINSPVCINLTVASLEDENFLPWLSGQLSANPEIARLLSANIAEAMAFSYPQGFRRLHEALRTHGARLGIARMGYRVSDIGLLSELGADHLKIDGLFVRGIADNMGNQALLRTYANIASSLGIPCIAEGVASQEDIDAAMACGAVGATGPAVGSA
jgi:EAL domain-containing protein (putative c-di-GMP-specific phosphodiesterase class I)